MITYLVYIVADPERSFWGGDIQGYPVKKKKMYNNLI